MTIVEQCLRPCRAEEIATISKTIELTRNIIANFFFTGGGAPPPPRGFADTTPRILSPRRGVAAGACAITLLLLAPLRGAEVKVDLSKERVGRPPATFEPMVDRKSVVEGKREGTG